MAGMDAMSALFGGSVSTPLWNDLQKTISRRMQSEVGAAFEEGVPAYGGQITPDATANQLRAFEAAGQLPLGMQRNRGVESAIGSLLSGMPAFQINPAASNQFYNDSVYLPAQREFQDTLQGLDARYGARFGRSGGQQEAFGRAATDLNTNLAAQRGQMVYADEQARRQAMENALGRQAQGIDSSLAYNNFQREGQLANIGLNAALGGEERAIQGQKNSEAYGKWQYSQPYNNPWLGLLGMSLAPPPTQTQQTPGILPGIMGLFTGGLGAMG